MVVTTMRRSAHVFAPILAATAVSLTGCHAHQDPTRCVDEQNHVVDAKFCAALPPGAQQPINGNMSNGGGYYGGGIFYPHIYRYYYGGGGGFTPGAIVTGGSYAPIAGRSYSGAGAASASGTSRGGFGGSFSSSGGHGGGGGE